MVYRAIRLVVCFCFISIQNILGDDKKQNYLEIYAGPSLSLISDLKYDQLFNYGVGISTGLIYRQIFDNSFGFRTGIQYSFSQSRYDFKDSFYIDNSLNNIGALFQGTYSVGFYPFVNKRYVKKIEFCLGAGLLLDYFSLNDSKVILNNNINPNLLNNENLISGKNVYPVMVGVNLSLSGIYKIDAIHNVTLTFDYFHSLNSLNSKGNSSFFLERTFISIGYSVPFGIIFK